MSQPIRQVIGPTKKRILDLLKDWKETQSITVDQSLPLEEKLNRIKQQIFVLEGLKLRLTKAANLLQTKNDEWAKLIQSLKGESKQQEADLYEQFNQPSDGSQGFIADMLYAQDQILVIENHLRELQYAKSTMETPTPVSSPAAFSEGRSFTSTAPTQAPEAQRGPPAASLTTKLPKLPLPEFYGDEINFASFWDVFESTIHNRTDLTAGDKFRYLAGLLKGDAFKIIAGIKVTGDNYQHAIAGLRERYGSSRVVKQNLYSQMEKLPICGSTKVQELQETLDSIEKILRQLETLHEGLNHTMLINQVKSKFPASICLEIERTKSSDSDWSMDELRESLKKVILIHKHASVASNVLNVSGKGSTQSKPSVRGSSYKTNFSDGVTRGVSLAAHTGAIPSPCIFCEGNHLHADCNKFKTTDKRQECLSSKKVCHFCLKPGHFKNVCPKVGTKKCKFCQNSTHNSALCFQKFGFPPSNHTQPHNSQRQQNQQNQYTHSRPPFPRGTRGSRGRGGRGQTTRSYYNSNYPQNTNTPTLMSGNPAQESDSHQVAPNHEDSNPPIQPQRQSSTNHLSSTISAMEVSAPNSSLEMLLTALATVVNPTDSKLQQRVRVVLDCCSEKSYLRSSVQNSLKLNPSSSQTLNVLAFGAAKPKQVKTDYVHFQLVLQNGSKLNIGAHSVDQISGSLYRPALPMADLEALSEYKPFLADKVPEVEEHFEIELLLGLNCFLTLVQTDHQISLPSGLSIVPSSLGLLIGGSNADTNQSLFGYQNAVDLPAVTFLNCTGGPENILPDATTLWSLPHIGIFDSAEENLDDKALERFNQSLVFKDGRYHMDWLWKEENPSLPDNHSGTMKRFVSLMKRYAADKEQKLLQACDVIIRDQLSQGILEVVPDPSKVNGPLHYLPHRAVVTPSKTTTKVRIVMDASSRSSPMDNSLNDCLFRGPILLPNLVGLLIRFRLHRLGVCSDVAKAFLQLMLNENQRDCTRIYWVKNLDHKPLWAPENLLVLRFTRVLFGSKSSPSMLNLTIDHHLSKYINDDVANTIRQNIYVDNFVISVDSAEKLHEIYTKGTKMFAAMGMHLREWQSNSKEFMETVEEKDKMAIPDDQSTTILGIKWNFVQDILTVGSLPSLAGILTKRKTLEVTSSCFDPLGLLNPLLLGLKLFIQNLWKLDVKWDDPLSKDLEVKFQKLLADVQKSMKMQIPRSYQLPDPESSFQLGVVCFCDASQEAYAANVYLCVYMADKTLSQLMFSKMRLAPIKGMTIPRMELLAVYIGAQSIQFAEKELHEPCVNGVLFSDSQCVLHWLKSTKKKPIFVENRLTVIKKCKDVSFRFVETEQNPADIATRIQTSESFENSFQKWMHGPRFLEKPKETWPNFKMPEISIPKIDEWETVEISPDKPEKKTACTLLVSKPEKHKDDSQGFIETKRFSKWKSLVFFTACIFLFLSKLLWNKLHKDKQSKFSHLKKIFSFDTAKGLSFEVFTAAKLYWIRKSQSSSFPEVIEALKRRIPNSLVQKLNLFLDSEGIIRLRGRIHNAPLEYDSRHPMLLHHRQHITQLIIGDFHFRLHHAGCETTLAALRQKFWIYKRARNTVKGMIKNCLTCIKITGPPYKLPAMPPLPIERLKHCKAFQFVGVDYFGPINIKQCGELVKIWVCIFTCFVSRAIHLEITGGLTTQQFIMCLRRFIARRGKPQLILSDNGPQFKLGSAVVKKASTIDLDWKDVKNYASREEINWRFVREFSPWSGGLYERLIGLVKTVLKKSLQQSQPTLEAMLTYLAESEAIVNSRPLVKISEDINDSFRIIRPIDFLTPKGLIGTEVLEEDHSDPEYFPTLDSVGKVMKWWCSSQKYLDQLWKQFIVGYTQTLLERYQYIHKQGHTSTETPNVGHMVIIHEDGIPRGQWRLGVITKLLKNSEGRVSAAEVKTKLGKLIKRPINLLHPLEIEAEGPIVEEKQNSKQESESRRITRSMTKTNNFLSFISFVIIACMFIQTGSGIQCPMDSKFNQVIHSQMCVKSGFIVKTDGSAYCWLEKKCEKHLLKNGLCGEECICPQWASQCSFADPPIDSHVDMVNFPETELDGVCSFIPDSKCSDIALKGAFFQIQLFDGTTHLMNSQNIQIEESIQNQFECVGEGIIDGTPRYCSVHQCDPLGKKICFYPSQEKAFFLSTNGKIQIKAWGTVEKKFYPQKLSTIKQTSCQGCELKCHKHGVELVLDSEMDKLLVCSTPGRCLTLNKPKLDNVIQLHSEVLLQDYNVQVSIWKLGTQIRELGISCEAIDFCETVSCIFCWPYLANPQCFTKSSSFFIIMTGIILLLLMIATGCMSFYVLLKLIYRLLWILAKSGKGVILFIFCCVKYCCQKCRKSSVKKKVTFKEDSDPETPHRRSHRRKSKQVYHPSFLQIVGTITTVLCFIQAAESCSKAVTLTAQSKNCAPLMDSGKAGICYISEATRLSLVPAGQQTCLQIRNHENHAMAILKIRIQHISLKCQARNMYFTRAFTMKVEGAKRCSTMGSCKGEKCSQYNSHSKFTEISSLANSRPGISGCFESCGCGGCQCFWCDSGCLFFRLFAEPTDEKTYEVFKCSTWQLKIEIEVELHLSDDGKIITEKLVLYPGKTAKLKTLEFALIGVTQPPLPILNQVFVTDGDHIFTVIQASETGMPIAGTIGEFQCGTREKAKNFNECVFTPNLCQCFPQESTVHCRCTQLSIAAMFSKAEHSLPLEMQGLTISGKGTDLSAQLGSLANLELQVTSQNVSLFYVYGPSTCQVTPISFKGCYSCVPGAKLKYSCKTDKGKNLLALVECGKDTNFNAICSETSHVDEVSINFQRADIEEPCTVSCGGPKTTFVLKGTLVFIEKEMVVNITDVHHGHKGKAEWSNPFSGLDFKHIFDFLKSNWLMVIFSILGAILCVYLILTICPILIQMVVSKVNRTIQSVKMTVSRKVNGKKTAPLTKVHTA